jgi:hypothetical protein
VGQSALARHPVRGIPPIRTNSKPIPHIPLPFEEIMKDVLKVKPPEKVQRKSDYNARVSK